MGVETKTIGALIDELCTTSQRMWHMQDEIMQAPDSEAGRLAKQLQRLNARRAQLIGAIDAALGAESCLSRKTYEGK